MDVNFKDKTTGVAGTPVNRSRLMGMQGYLGGTTTIEETSPTVTTITETSDEGTTITTITEGANSTTIQRQFTAANGQVITKTTTISESGTTTTITETISG